MTGHRGDLSQHRLQGRRQKAGPVMNPKQRRGRLKVRGGGQPRQRVAAATSVPASPASQVVSDEELQVRPEKPIRRQKGGAGPDRGGRAPMRPANAPASAPVPAPSQITSFGELERRQEREERSHVR